MGRRRKKVVRISRKRLPKVFLCPQCGNKAVQVTMMKGEGRAVVRCGSCGLKEEFTTTSSSQPIDIYCKFTDKFYTSTQGV